MGMKVIKINNQSWTFLDIIYLLICNQPTFVIWNSPVNYIHTLFDFDKINIHFFVIINNYLILKKYIKRFD